MKIKEVIIVEGKYDKIKLDSLLDATVISLDGFQIFKDKEKKELIKMYAEKRGIVILTDSDSAGFLIRNHLKGWIDPKCIKNAYIPEIEGKEKRKEKAGKEGLLGVEGMTKEIILDALKKAGCTKNEKADLTPVTKTDLFASGLSGSENSAKLRQAFLKKAGFPSKLSSNAFLDAINSFLGKEEFEKILKEIKKDS
ncbi:MAG: DUF4093 domain-containing protein [Clostridia bacterium]|nr:DUF4093 domain-containing protein [Clostridia bacterium]